MRYDPRDMTHGNLWKQILIFSLPLMASNLLQVLFNMSDIAVVGQFAGSHALGSVGSTATLAALYSGFLIGMGAVRTRASSARASGKIPARRSIRRLRCAWGWA